MREPSHGVARFGVIGLNADLYSMCPQVRLGAKMTSLQRWPKFALRACDLISHGGVHGIYCNFLHSSTS